MLPIELSDVKIDMPSSLIDIDSSRPDNKLDESINSVIRVGGDDDTQSIGNTSVISVVKVEHDDEEKGVTGEDQEIEDDKAADVENLTLSIAQFEMLLSDLKTKHLAEKRML